MSEITPGRYRITKSDRDAVVKVYVNPHPDHDPENLNDLFVVFPDEQDESPLEEFPLEAIVADKWERIGD